MSEQSEPYLASAQISIRLTVADWSVVLTHLQVGAYCSVVDVIQRLVAQAAPQIEAAHQVTKLQTAEKTPAPAPIEDARVH